MFKKGIFLIEKKYIFIQGGLTAMSKGIKNELQKKIDILCKKKHLEKSNTFMITDT